MAEQSFPFENIDTTESQFSEWATNFQETGVQGSPTGTELGITVTGSDLNLTVAAGQAFIRGHYYINTSDLVLAVTSAGTDTRIDIVVVELDPETNTIVTKLVQGEAVSVDPVAPTLTQSATGIYQLPIATLTIPASTVAITSGMLVDTRTFMGNRIGIWTTATRPANPTAYQTIGYNTTIEAHESWNGTAWVGFFDPISTEGDLVVGDGTGQASRLGIGADDQVLTVVSGVPAWADASGGNYYNISEPGTYTVDLPAGYYKGESIGRIIVGSEDVDGELTLTNFPTGIDSLTVPYVFSFTSRTFPWGNDITSIAYGANIFVAAGDDADFATSTDGITWTARTGSIPGYTKHAVIFAGGQFVSVARDGYIETSPDGITWTEITRLFYSSLFGLAYGAGLYVSVGDAGKLISSPDGITWTERTSGTSNALRCVTYGDALFVAGGDSGEIITSPDGINWTSRTSGFSSDAVLGITYDGSGTYLAAGESAKVATSTDGISWTARSTGASSGYDFAHASYGNGQFMIGGSYRRFMLSPDGITWTIRNVSFSGSATVVTNSIYADGLFIAVGDDGNLSTSPGKVGSAVLALEPKLPMIELP